MAGASLKKLMNYILGDEDIQDEYDEEEYNSDYQEDYENEEENEGEALSIFKRKNKVVSMPQPQQIRMKISKPTNFEQADEVVTKF